MSVETARTILETVAAVAPEPWRSQVVRALEELETPEERRRRYEREKKRAQRMNGKKDPDPPDPPGGSPPVPDLSPFVSPNVPGCPEVTSPSSSSGSGCSSLRISSLPLSLLPTETESKTAKRARAGARTAMPDPERSPQAFEAFAARWSLPLSPILSRSVPESTRREAAKFVAHALKTGARYARWDWAWREWLNRAPDFNRNGSVPTTPRRPAPAPPSRPEATQAEVEAAVRAHLEGHAVPPLPGGSSDAR